MVKRSEKASVPTRKSLKFGGAPSHSLVRSFCVRFFRDGSTRWGTPRDIFARGSALGRPRHRRGFGQQQLQLDAAATFQPRSLDRHRSKKGYAFSLDGLFV